MNGSVKIFCLFIERNEMVNLVASSVHFVTLYIASN